MKTYTIKEGCKYYKDGRTYVEGDRISVPDNYPMSCTFLVVEPSEKGLAKEALPSADVTADAEATGPDVEEKPKQRKKLALDNY